MPLEVHADVQDADDINAGFDLPKEDDVRLGEVFAVTLSYLVAGASSARVLGDGRDRACHQANIVLRLLLSPSLDCIVPDFVEVCLGTRREDVAAHAAAFAPRLLFWRLRPMNSSTSNGLEAP